MNESQAQAYAVIMDLQLQRDTLGAMIQQLKKIYGSPVPDAAGGNLPITRKETTEETPARSPKKMNVEAARKSEKPTEKICHKCGPPPQPLKDFPNNKGCRDGHTGTCKKCTAARIKKNCRKTHPPKTARRAAADPPRDEPSDSPEAGGSDFPRTCELCHSVCSTSARYTRHMKLVHQKDLA